MIDDKFIADLRAMPLGDLMAGMVNGPCYKVPGIREPNSHLYCSWKIEDRESEDMTLGQMSKRYMQPAMLSLAEHMNKHDVVLCMPLACCEPNNGARQTCYTDQIMPVRLTINYDGLPVDWPGGYRFTIDLLADLLDKPNLE